MAPSKEENQRGDSGERGNREESEERGNSLFTVSTLNMWNVV